MRPVIIRHKPVVTQLIQPDAIVFCAGRFVLHAVIAAHVPRLGSSLIHQSLRSSHIAALYSGKVLSILVGLRLPAEHQPALTAQVVLARLPQLEGVRSAHARLGNALAIFILCGLRIGCALPCRISLGGLLG